MTISLHHSTDSALIEYCRANRLRFDSLKWQDTWLIACMSLILSAVWSFAVSVVVHAFVFLVSSAVGGTTSRTTAECFDAMVSKDADLVFLEYSYNDR